MGQARVTRRVGAGALAILLLTGTAQAAGQSRFVSYDSEAECLGAHTLAPGVCRSAFANARAEYEAKTPSFASRALCVRRFSSCMAWPPGARAATATFRPSWDGVDIVDTPGEHSVTPAPGGAMTGIRFAARPLGEEALPLVIRGAAGLSPPVRPGGGAPVAGRPGRHGPASAIVQRTGAPEPASPPGAPPPPGSGFKIEDGVLTYPAPARFQPRNLPRP